MKDLNLDVCKELLGKNFISSYYGCDTFVKIIITCTCLTSEIVRKLSEYDNFYISAFDNFPTIVIRLKRI